MRLSASDPRVAAAAFDTRLTDGLGGLPAAEQLIAQSDRAEQFPAPVHDLLGDLGLADYCLPAQHGGGSADHEVLLHLWRVLARRDLSLVVAHGATHLGAAAVWIAGTERQLAELVESVRGGTVVGWGLPEPYCAAEIEHAELTAERIGDRYRLAGTKWPLASARSGLAVVLARTGPGEDERSLLMIRTDALAPGTFRALPKVLTHGIRGAEISGISFDGAEIPADALVGAEGTGTKTVLCARQLTRSVCAALPLGAGEHALRIATAWAVEESVADGRPLAALPTVRAGLVRSAALLAAMESAAVLTARSAHSLTDELSVLSSIVKVLAPALGDVLIGELAEVAGSRATPCGGAADGAAYAADAAFQKVARDHQTLVIFDGDGSVVRDEVIGQFPRLVTGFLEGTADRDGLDRAKALGTKVGRLDPARLGSRSRRGCSAVQSLPALTAEIGEFVEHAADELRELFDLARLLTWLADETHARMTEISPAARPTAEAYELASSYELLYAGAAVLHLWRAGVGERDDEPLWQGALWARAALYELLALLHHRLGLAPPLRNALRDEDAEQLLALLRAAVADGAPVTPFGPVAGHEYEEGRL